MPESVSSGIALALTLSVPLALAAPLRLGSRAGRPFDQLGVRWWAGFLLAMVPLVVLHAVGAPRVMSLGAVALASVFAAIRGASHRSLPRAPIEPARWALYALMAVLIGVAVMHTLATPVVEWDAVEIWWAKARALEDWRPLVELVRPTYPDLGPIAWSVLARAAGGFEPAGRVVLPVAATMALFSLVELAPRRLDAASAMILGVLAIVFYGANEFTNGYQDALLAAGIGVSATTLASALAPMERRTPQVVRGFAIAGTLGLIKSEGLPIGLGIVLAYAIVAWAMAPAVDRRAAMRTLLIPGASYLALAVIWPLILVAHGFGPIERQEGTFSVSGVLAIPSRFGERLPQIGHQLLVLGGNPMRLVVFAGAVTLALAVVIWLQRAMPAGTRRALVFLALVGAFHLTFVLVVFLATEVPLAWHLDTALLRLLLQLRFVLAAFVAIMAFELVSLVQGRTAKNELAAT